jgi:hypothetical protein
LLIHCSALGHPLGCTGTRQVVTALSELRRRNKRIAVTSMCVGTVSLLPRLSSWYRRSNMLAGDGHGWGVRLGALNVHNITPKSKPFRGRAFSVYPICEDRDKLSVTMSPILARSSMFLSEKVVLPDNAAHAVAIYNANPPSPNPPRSDPLFSLPSSSPNMNT